MFCLWDQRLRARSSWLAAAANSGIDQGFTDDACRKPRAKAAFVVATTYRIHQQIPRLKSKSFSASLLLRRINGRYGPDKKKPGSKPGKVKVRRISQNLPEGTAETSAPGGRKRCRVEISHG